MRPPRFRIRTLMIAVAAVAILLGGPHEWKRTESWRRYCQNQADLLGFLIEYDAYWSNPEHFKQSESEGDSRAHIAHLRRDYERWHPHAKLFVKLRRKWLVGTWFPWIELDPDPPYLPQSDRNVGSPFMPKEVLNPVDTCKRAL